MRYGILFMMALVAAVGSMVLVQQNATNQSSTSNYTAQAAPDQTKFCADFQNDDGTTGTSCEYKSKGECKKGSIATGDEGLGCRKNNGDEPDGGNNLSPDEDGEGSGSGPND